ncbi:uncharacterized protein N7503_001419 [Penicillium pulvis]|uniref:uncharacterized protein n=1 Tax=Penicillium pulvis TaxID=1562058 RepID=UPI002546C98A|nr:uncharacterized protein N7503_001419 [Penicillium pulvis]KAJ5809201.1 hypothetical protein N7503_001419 [Penicillium pulvis]
MPNQEELSSLLGELSIDDDQNELHTFELPGDNDDFDRRFSRISRLTVRPSSQMRSIIQCTKR